MNKNILLIVGGIVIVGGAVVLVMVDAPEEVSVIAIEDSVIQVETGTIVEEIAEVETVEREVVVGEEADEVILPEAKSPVVEEAVVSTPVTIGFGGLILASEFQTKMNSGEYVVLDVRAPKEYIEQRIGDDATLVNFYDTDFAEQLNALDKSKKYLLHCRSGGRSSSATKIMKNLGFEEFYELKGGINSWNKAGLPTFSG